MTSNTTPRTSYQRKSAALHCVLTAVLIVFLTSHAYSAKSAKSAKRTIVTVSLEHKIPVELNASGIGKREIDIVFKDSITYLPMIEMFNYLGVKVSLDSFALEIRGFYKSADNEIVVDLNTGRTIIGKREYTMSEEDFILTATEVYVRIEVINDMFDLDFNYSPRVLRVDLRKTKDLPAFLTSARRRHFQPLSKRVQIPEPSVYYGREVSFLGAGRFDWTASILYGKTPNGKAQFSARHTGKLGMQMLGGDLTAQLIGNTRLTTGTSSYKNTVHGQIRYPVFSSKILKQIIVGDFYTLGIVPRQVKGIELTNRPFTQRVFFSREVFRGSFEPNTDIELNMTATGRSTIQSDENGSYQYDYPVLYGQGLMEITSYDPWGQARVLRYRMNIPRTVIPEGEIEYSVSSGKLEEASKSFGNSTTMFSNYAIWGVSSDLTIGAKLEYLNLAGGQILRPNGVDTFYVPRLGGLQDTLFRTHLDTTNSSSRKMYSAITATTLLYRGLALDAMIAPSAFSRLGLDWVFPSNARVSLSGFQYSRNSIFNVDRRFNSVELQATSPFDINGAAHIVPEFFGGITNYENSRERDIQVGASAAFSFFYPRISSQYTWRSDNITGKKDSLTVHLTSLSVGASLPGGVSLISELIFDHLNSKILTYRAAFTKRFSNSFLFSASYLGSSSYNNLGVRFEYLFPFVRTQGTISRGSSPGGSSQTQYTMYGSGSVSYDPNTPSFYFQNQPSYVGYGGIDINPFLDVNGNGKLDKGESRIDPVRVYIENATRSKYLNSQTRTLSGKKLTIDRIPTYEEYDVYLDPQSMENPVWVPEYGSVRLLSEPNYVRRINFPVVSGGTVRGNIKSTGGIGKPVEGIKIILTLIQSETKRKYIRTTSSFSTGEFEFNQVAPGIYRIEIDGNQLQILGYTAEPINRQVDVVARPEGDNINGVDFIINIK